jgi:hypothetical protein
MEKQLWYTFYASIALGVLLGVVVTVGFPNLEGSVITGALNRTVSFLQISQSDRIYFEILAAAAVVGAVALTIYEAGKTFSNSGEYGIYAATCGLIGGFFVAFGRLGFLGLLGIIILIIGVVLVYRNEREPPGSPSNRKR